MKYYPKLGQPIHAERYDPADPQCVERIESFLQTHFPLLRCQVRNDKELEFIFRGTPNHRTCYNDREEVQYICRMGEKEKELLKAMHEWPMSQERAGISQRDWMATTILAGILAHTKSTELAIDMAVEATDALMLELHKDKL